jgi:uncharacterized protein YyaL (SSP411 family)
MMSPRGADVQKLRAVLGQSSRRFVALLALAAVIVVPAPPAWGYAHHASKVRFVEHSPAAFDAARREGKPALLLISAVWCYWCKYFDREVLQDAEVSTYLNQHYVSVFADHDRRPDLVRKHVRGLPMIVLFGADGRIRQSFAGVLKKNDFLAVLRNVATSPPPATDTRPIAAPKTAPVTAEAYRVLREGMLTFVNEQLDTVYGGFGTGDKHPQPRLLAYLLERYQATGERRYLVPVEKSLEGILGGLYDRVDGGFFRYAEGREWRQPHYEKLLHLNAALAAVLSTAHKVTGNPRYREAADATIAYLLRTLRDPKGGGFHSSQSADPAYYRLPPQERRAARQPPVNRGKITAWNAEAAIALLALSQSSGRRDLREVALRTLDFLRTNTVGAKGASNLYEYRTGAKQGQGQLDANAWAALAFLEGYRVTRIEAYRQTAERVLGFAIADLFDTERGAFGEARSSPPPLDANGVMAEALLRAHRLAGGTDYLTVARRVLSALGATASALLIESDDGAVRVDDAAYYLRAYAQAVGEPQEGERWR